uniref:Uncharacterized protein n=1 Tax=Heterorhabditis bacteriophora TaxID=37862 RepID=A0A1I7WEG2_HETBA
MDSSVLFSYKTSGRTILRRSHAHPSGEKTQLFLFLNIVLIFIHSLNLLMSTKQMNLTLSMLAQSIIPMVLSTIMIFGNFAFLEGVVQYEFNSKLKYLKIKFSI